MCPLPEEALEEEERPRLPPRRWVLQCAGAFAAVAFVGGLMIAPGGIVERLGGMTPATTLSLPRADLEGGQYYDQQWLNPDTGMPYADQVDAQSIDHASAEPALYFNDDDDEPLEGAEVSTVSRREDHDGSGGNAQVSTVSRRTPEKAALPSGTDWTSRDYAVTYAAPDVDPNRIIYEDERPAYENDPAAYESDGAAYDDMGAYDPYQDGYDEPFYEEGYDAFDTGA